MKNKVKKWIERLMEQRRSEHEIDVMCLIIALFVTLIFLTCTMEDWMNK